MQNARAHAARQQDRLNAALADKSRSEQQLVDAQAAIEYHASKAAELQLTIQSQAESIADLKVDAHLAPHEQ